jgi:hypothetical protein
MADLNSLALCAEIIEASSFSETARRLKIPVSTVILRGGCTDAWNCLLEDKYAV